MTDVEPGVPERIDLLRDLTDEARRAVADRAVRRRVPAKSILFRGGDPCKGVYFVLGGRFEIYRSGPDGRRQVLHVVGPGDVLGDVPLLDDGPYPASARAAVDGEVLFLSCTDVQRLRRERPEVADAVARDLGRRLRELVGLVETISLRDVPERVATLIVARARDHGVLREGGRLDMGRTQAEIAAELGTTREGVGRALARLGKRGAIRHEGSRVEIVDLRSLERAGGGA